MNCTFTILQNDKKTLTALRLQPDLTKVSYKLAEENAIAAMIRYLKWAITMKDSISCGSNALN